MYPKDTEKWKQFTTRGVCGAKRSKLFCIPKILKNESNSQRCSKGKDISFCCFVSQRYWKMKAIHNMVVRVVHSNRVVLYPKDTEKWKQFTTRNCFLINTIKLFCIPKILKNESNSQQCRACFFWVQCCFVSQRYWKMKAIHNNKRDDSLFYRVVLYPKDTEKWKQFTTCNASFQREILLFCIPKILKNESNSQPAYSISSKTSCCFVSQRYWKMKAIHNK